MPGYSLWFYAYCKLRPGLERQAKGDGMRRSMAVTRGVVKTSPEVVEKVEEAKRLLGREGEELGVYEISGSKLKPLCWANEAVLLDMDYVNELPSEISTVMVAERVEQALQGNLARERHAIATSMAGGISMGALVVLLRKGKPNTLRRAYTAAIAGTMFFSVPFSMSSLMEDRLYPLKKIAARLQATRPELMQQLYAFEQEKLQAAQRDLDSAWTQIRSGGTSNPQQSQAPPGAQGQPNQPVLEQMILQEAQQRCACLTPFVAAAA